MPLPVRPPVQVLPSYSLTSDLLGFLRCGLQYRYTRLGNMPSSHPVQLWYGQFIHAVLEECFREYREDGQRLPPRAGSDLETIMDKVDRRLSASNIRCWSRASAELGRVRAQAAVNELGPLLFPMINQAEVRVRGSRPLPAGLKGIISRDIQRYEMLGVIDVVSEVELFKNPATKNNRLLELIIEDLPAPPPPEFEVIVDYKGMKRPDLEKHRKDFESIYTWQIHTYAHLRGLLTTKPVIAGLLIYLNELMPTRSDFRALQKALSSKSKDVLLPEPGSEDERILKAWKPKTRDEQPPLLSFDFRLRRAVRVVPIDQASVESSLQQFDATVARIETCLANETRTGRIIHSWEKNPSHEPTCEACDSKTYCPDFDGASRPQIPGIKN